MSDDVMVEINKGLIVWARETAPFSQETLAEKVGITYKEMWTLELVSSQKIRMGLLKKIAEATKRPIAAFFLPEVPKCRKSIAVRETEEELETLKAERDALRERLGAAVEGLEKAVKLCDWCDGTRKRVNMVNRTILERPCENCAEAREALERAREEGTG